jgi:hypothetical protein
MITVERFGGCFPIPRPELGHHNSIMSSSFPLERFLLGEPLELPESSLHALHLAPYAYHIYSQHHMLEQAQKFRAAHVQAQARHALVKHQLLPLMRAWLERGLRPVLRKGFALAEFEYAQSSRSANRFYGDVDVWFPEDQAALATQMAQDLGWSLEWLQDAWSQKYSHQESSLISPNKLITLEIHHRLVPGYPSVAARAFDAKIAQKLVWLEWEGLKIPLLEPLDALLSGWLDRARADFWGRKVADVLDACLLLERYQITAKDALARAKELGCSRTLHMILLDFDPWRGRWNLAQPNRPQRWYRVLRSFADFGGSPEWDRLWHGGPRYVAETLRQLPNAVQVCQYLKHKPDMHELLRNLERRPRAVGDRSRAKAQAIVRGSRWALVLLGWRKDSCVPRSLTAFRALQLEGHKPHFVSGIRRQGAALLGHAWVELEGKPIYGSGDEQAPSQFKENFRYPSKT